MTSEITYKVLWVEDDEDIIEGTKANALDYHLELEHYTNWEEAETALKANFESFSAIILDATCKIKKDEIEKEEFIMPVLSAIMNIFGEKQRYIPWFILSAGTATTFSNIVTGVSYLHREEEWGDFLYLKTAPDDDKQSSTKLFEKIEMLAKGQVSNMVLYRHASVFRYLGKDKLISARARKILIKMLSALYSPENNTYFQYQGNPIRQVLEYMFRAAHPYGLLPDEFFENNKVAFQLCSLFMCGKVANCENKKDKTKTSYRWKYPPTTYKSDRDITDPIFPRDISSLVNHIRIATNIDSHSEDDDEQWRVDESKKEHFFTLVMATCHIIKWFGNYIEDNNDPEINKQNINFITTQA